jgi:hypothetical protein
MDSFLRQIKGKGRGRDVAERSIVAAYRSCFCPCSRTTLLYDSLYDDAKGIVNIAREKEIKEACK